MSPNSTVHNQTRHWQALDAAHHIHPFSDTAALGKEGVRVITSAKGIYLTDSEGKRLLDGMAGLWCVQLGYGNDELAEAGAKALHELPYYNHFFKTSNPYTIDLAAKLAQLLPQGLERIMFANSGSEANDSALKLIRYYWNLQGKPKKKIHLSRELAYHGVTMAAASLSGLTPMHPQFDLPLPGFEKVPTVYWYGAKAHGYGDITPDDFGTLIAQKLEEKILALGPEHVASFSAEPIHGAGGLIFPPATYWPAVQEICRKYDVLLHVDEVITGFGRTGNWFGSHTYGIRPDIMTMAKGLSSGYQPISAVALGPRMGDAIANANEELVHGYTYSGHPVACAVALKNLEIMERERIPEVVGKDTGPYLHAKLREALGDHVLVGEIRGAGLLAAIELVDDKAERRFFPEIGDTGTICRNHCFKEGLVMRAIRDTMVLSPPLTITRPEIDELVRLARRCIDLTARDLGRL
ncbi:MAG: aminotransferase class III-fold pyridoxal phosphate-dependent enzyme [Alphaproteobacteria bacterium]|nr:aminotransferase class III-fold pyridoxal phosphate-dependent enzyme [Alphaproteobacteria bacterium]